MLNLNFLSFSEAQPLTLKFDHDLALANEDKKQETMGRENVQKELDNFKLVKFG